jgi:hypothetical protein
MPTDNLLQMLLDTVRQHIPPGAEWMPLAATAVVALVGLVFMVKGARLAPVLAALVLGAIGGFAAPLVARLLNLPLWPAVTACSAAGLLLGVILFRLWLALLVGGCLALVSLGAYWHQSLRDPLNDYLSAGLDRDKQLVTLPEAGSPATPSAQWQTELADLWSYLSVQVPNFQASFWALVGSTGLAGLIFGLLLPKLARAFWAATIGTALLYLATGTILQLHWPHLVPWLQRQGLLVVAGLWALSLVFNWADVRGVRPKKAAAPAAKPAAA